MKPIQNNATLTSYINEQKNSIEMLQKINETLLKDPKNKELLHFQSALKNNIALIETLLAFPNMLKKTITAIRQNQGTNYTPHENARVLASLLDTIQKSQEGQESTEILIKILKIVSQVTNPQLPVDAFTLKTISDLLTYINTMMAQDKALKQQIDIIFPKDDLKKSDARRTFFNSLGIQFNTLGTFFQTTLIKPTEDAFQAACSLAVTASEIFTDQHMDYFKIFNSIDNMSDVIYAMPQELLPDPLKQYSDHYHHAKQYVNQVISALGQLTGTTSHGLNKTTPIESSSTPATIKTAADSITEVLTRFESLSEKNLGSTKNQLALSFNTTQNEQLQKGKTTTSSTTHNITHHKIQEVLNRLTPLCDHILEGFNQQLASTQDLLTLCPNDPLKKLCESKINYLNALIKCNSSLLEDMKSGGKLALQLKQLINGEKLSANALHLTNQLLSIALEVTHPSNQMTDATLQEKLLAYTLNQSDYTINLVEAKHSFENQFNLTPPPPELIIQLGNPLYQIAPTSKLIHKGVNHLINLGKTNILEPLGCQFVTITALALAFPEALIADIVTGILIQPDLKKRLGSMFQSFTNYLMPETNAVSKFISHQQQKLTDTFSNYICHLLDIEVEKVLEQKAYEYVTSNPVNRLKLNKNERDAFSGFYLQYRALKKVNPNLNKTECIQHLFKQVLQDKSESLQQKMIQAFNNELETVDKALMNIPTMTQGSDNMSQLEEELAFLISNIDFKKPDEKALIVMTLCNRLIMMQFEASNQLVDSEKRKLQQKAIGLITAVLQKLEKDDEKNEIRTQLRAEAIIPATQYATKFKLNELQKNLSNSLELIDKGIKDREQQQHADANENEPKRLGRTVFAVEISKSTTMNLLYKIIKGLMNDTLFSKFTNLCQYAITSLFHKTQNIPEMARTYPTNACLEDEKTTLNALKIKLDGLKDLIDAQIKDQNTIDYEIIKPTTSKFGRRGSFLQRLKTHDTIDTRALLIEQQSKELSQQLEETENILKSPATYDARWVGGTNEELENYKKTFNQINELTAQIMVLNHAKTKMNPELKTHKIPANHAATVVETTAQSNKDKACQNPSQEKQAINTIVPKMDSDNKSTAETINHSAYFKKSLFQLQSTQPTEEILTNDSKSPKNRNRA